MIETSIGASEAGGRLVRIQAGMDPMTTILLDDHGRAWDAHSPVLRRFLQCPVSDFDFSSYVVDNLGFVAVTMIDGRSARIRFRPRTACGISIASALYLIADRAVERIIVVSAGDDVVDHIFPRASQAMAYIEDQVARARQHLSPTFRSRELPITALAKEAEPLAVLFTRWLECDQTRDNGELKGLLDLQSLQRFVIIEPVDGRLIFAEIGSGFESFGRTWQRHAPGLPLEEQPDYHYGQWVRGVYDHVLHTGKPLFDDVDAIIRRPHRNDRLRVHYRRLILPCGSIGSKPARLVGASLVENVASTI
ncbi:MULTISPECIES: hypothetical protein [Bradyrhizobium]|uniref:Uncharacterized protein n=1 Tax=Bradyrhizobium aeschynomenes TaxID=2734909 RepID=A0ABX2CG49_9BRAD|nr:MULTISPECIES: hypothetical protein [Bradyrhizobium]NPU66307.1 hypothetical protein [Bradyrhizobium aeschynomenes]NPV20019.1 hypothetical protein [Bradyrhizobium aeschynomenes]